MKAELIIQFNLELSCIEFLTFIKEKKETLNEVKSFIETSLISNSYN